MSELPNGWTKAAVEELAAEEPASLTDGPFGSNLKTSHYTDQGPRVIRLQNIGESVFVDEGAHISEEHFHKLRRHEARAGDVVIAMLGETLPRACIVPQFVGPAIVKADCVRLRVNAGLATPPYISHALNSAQLRKQASELVHGVGRPRLGLKLLRTLQVPLAPFGEQRRIAESVDSYFSRLDDAEATLERVQRSLKRYRASVLQAAVEGRLVPTEAELARKEGRDYEPASVLLERILAERRRRWEESELAKMKAKGKAPKDAQWKSRYVGPLEINTTGLPDLPEGWCWATLSAIADIRLGKMLSRKAFQGDLEQLPYLRNQNVRWGHIDLSDLKSMGFKLSEFERFSVVSGDLLVCEGGEPARSAVLQYQAFPRLMYQKALHRVRPYVPLVRNEFLQLCLWHYAQANVMLPRASETTIKHLPLEEIKVLRFPIPPISEQHRIVSAASHLLSAGEHLAAEIERLRGLTGHLRQSILQWAFQGKLVDQDPHDEPASVLLERIRAQREAAAAAKKPARGRVKSDKP